MCSGVLPAQALGVSSGRWRGPAHVISVSGGLWVLCLVGFFFRGEERFSGLLMPFLVQRFSLAQLKVLPVAFGIVNCFVDYVE